MLGSPELSPSDVSALVPSPSPAGAPGGVSGASLVTLSLFPIQIRNVGTGLCADTKHGALGSPLRLEICVRGRGEAAWNNMQVRATPGAGSQVLCAVCGSLDVLRAERERPWVNTE